MTIQELINELNRFPNKDRLIYLATDEEKNEIKVVNYVGMEEIEKKNNDGTYEIPVLYPGNINILL